MLLYAPQSDLSEPETAILADYIEDGGKLFVLAGPVEGASFPTLYAMLEPYGVTTAEGIVLEGDSGHYYYGYPYLLMPDLGSHSITDSLIDEGYYPLLPLAQGMTVGSGSGTVTELLTTSSSAFSKTAGFDLTSYDKEEGDTDGPFTLAVNVDTNGGGQLIWVSAADFLNDYYNAYASGANVDFAMNAISSLLGEPESMAIRSKSFDYDYLTISDATAATLKTLLIGVFPVTYLALGEVIVLRKRGMQREANH